VSLTVPKLVREEVIRDQWGKVVLERTFQLPTGEERFLVWGGKVTPSIIFPITRDENVVAVREFRYGANEFVIQLPGGCPAEHESAEATASKELEEETGFRAERFVRLGKRPLWFEPTACITPYVPLLALGCRKTGEPKLDKTEILEPVLFPLADWITKIHSGEIRDSKSIAVTFLALAELGWKVGRSPEMPR